MELVSGSMSVKEKISKIFRYSMTLISPELNTRVCYRIKTGKKLNTTNPSDFKEKLVKLKLEVYDHSDLVKECSDKYAVRNYIRKNLGNSDCDSVLNNLIAVYDTVDEIDWDSLPNQFAMKWNFGCGFNLIVKDKTKLDVEDSKKKLKKWGKTKYYLGYAEMQYKGVEKKIIVEKYLAKSDGSLPEDYKLYCFNGKCRAILYITGRGEKEIVGFFDEKWEYLGGTGKAEYEECTELPAKPKSLEQMIKVAEILAKPFPFVRVDFYDVNGDAIFGEMTFTPASGTRAAETIVHGKTMGELLEI